MLISALRITRSAFRLAWLLTTLSLLSVSILPHAVSALGRDMFIVRGASMQPDIPLGAVIIVEHTDPTAISTGDVISFHAPNGPVVTHRVASVSLNDQGDGAPGFVTKGDANAADDPGAVPASALIGRVEFVVPMLGFVLALLASTFGIVASFGLLIGLLLAIKFIDELLAALRRAPQPGVVVAEPAH